MYISDIALDDYRSYHSQVVHLEPGICLLIGANGQGKTNFVEAVSYLTNFHSHRASADTALVRFQAQNNYLTTPVEQQIAGSENSVQNFETVPPELTSTTGETANSPLETDTSGETNFPATAVQSAPTAAVIRVKAQVNGRPLLVDLEILAGKANRARLARNTVKPKEVRGLIKTVLFAPEDLQILRGDPAARRRLLDDLLVLVEPVLAAALASQQKILKQRAALLKEAQKRQRRGKDWNDLQPTIQIFNEQLATVAGKIIAGRKRLVAALKPYAKENYRLVLGEEHAAHSAQNLSLEYQPALPLTPDATTATEITEQLLSLASELVVEEVARGANLLGAHRDDLLISLDALPVKGYASQGETWTAALALRLAQFELLDSLGETPILLLDDVFSELDASRRSALVKFMERADQVIVTAAVAADLPANLNAKRYHVERTPQGTVISAVTEQPPVSTSTSAVDDEGTNNEDS